MTFTGREEAINLSNMATIPTTLVNQLSVKLRPTDITNGLGKAMVFDHPLHIQVFNGNELIILYQLATKFVKEVLPLVGYFFVLASYLYSSFIPSITPLLSFRHSALQSGQPFLRLTKILGSREVLTIGGNSKILQSQIKANLTPLIGWFINFLLYLDGGEIFTTLGSRYGKVFHCTFNWTMQDYFNPAYLGDKYLFIPSRYFVIDLKSLGKLARLLTMLLFEGWEVSMFIEKVIVGYVKIAYCHLQGLGMCLIQPNVLRFFLEFSQHLLGIVIIQAFTRFSVIVSSLSQKMVINKATCTKLPGEVGLLFSIWVKSEFVSTFDIHAYNYTLVFVKEQIC